MRQSQIYYIVFRRENRNTAGSKAPDDIASICESEGYRQLVMPMSPDVKNWVVKKAWLLTAGVSSWIRLAKQIPDGAVILFQHPSYGMRISRYFVKRLKKTKNCRFIALIHDLESLRKGISGIMENNSRTNQIADNEFLKLFDVVICHNEKMRQYLISGGFEPDRLINLDIFDYLFETEREEHRRNRTEPSIAIAGNLAIGKCAYIYEICRDGRNQDLTIHLYGNYYQQDAAFPQMVYHGSLPPEKLPEEIQGDFGLVWDGPSIEACIGNTGEYLRYNNPHKASLYLASGMPVIVWAQSALAEFVRKNAVGLVVDNLADIDKVIELLSDEEYNLLCGNVKIISQKLKSGYYFRTAMDAALSRLQSESVE